MTADLVGLADRVTVVCTKCGKTVSDVIRDTDPPGTVRVESWCDDCDDGDFHHETAFDANGKELP
jgi:hypothetical protein